jgi:hypothetical protein
MLFALLIVLIILSFACSIWALVIIFKRSIIGGLLSLFFGLPMLYFLVTGWGKEGEDIKAPFFLSLVLYGIAIAIGVSMGAGAAKDMQDGFKQQMSAPPARSAPSFREPSTPPPESVRISNPPAPQATGVPRTDMVKDAPRRKRVQSDCVYKPVMTDEDIAKCR